MVHLIVHLVIVHLPQLAFTKNLHFTATCSLHLIYNKSKSTCKATVEAALAYKGLGCYELVLNTAKQV